MNQTIAAEEMSNALQPSKLVINDFPSTKGRMLEKQMSAFDSSLTKNFTLNSSSAICGVGPKKSYLT